jgi:RimJ/RimL family protein N-acetyltransferase
MQIAKKIVIFETPRLFARQIEPADVTAMHKVYGDADAMRWVGDGKPLDLSECRHWIEVTLRNYAKRGYGMFALASRDTGAIIGFCGLVHPGGQSEAELKYALSRAYWGKGLATEAAAAMLSFAASAQGIERVIATVDPDNIASQRVLLKAGMCRGPDRQEEDASTTLVFVWQQERSGNQEF